MMGVAGPLITVAELAALLGTNDLVVADCRAGSAADLDAGRRAYMEGHIPGAVYFHLEEDLSAPMGEHGGRHPLPDPALLGSTLGKAGVGSGTGVVVYDESGAHAARFWWLLRWLGHENVAVLDGGWRAWVAAGQPVTAAVPSPTARTFGPQPRMELVAAMTEVRDRPAGKVVIDARSPQRWAGQLDPLDPKRGHIPGSVNRFWMDGLNPDGTWRSPAEQAARFAGLPEGKDLIHQCGSGVTACGNLLARAIAGLEPGRLYVGSWSDWCTYPENPIELPK